MVPDATALIRIDLDQFKLHLTINQKIEVSLHFDSPSRKFYLSVIALVVHEMKRSGKVAAIPLEAHHQDLALLNETVGGGAGSSSKQNLIPRIYKKWKSALPDLENAPLFRIPGRKKQYGDGIEKTYQFGDEEKDCWANLFDYHGSGENVRLQFSIDRIGAGLDDVVIAYGKDSNLRDADAWEKFLEDLRQYPREESEKDPGDAFDSLKPPKSKFQIKRIIEKKPRQWIALAAAIMLVTGAAVSAVWYLYLRPFPSIEPASLEKMAFPLPEKPSIAVLPFDNFSNDPEQQYFSDGLAENIITHLSQIHSLFVISRESTFTYKGKDVKVQQVAEELGVRYVLEGAVQRVENRIRVTAQLIDATSGRHLWADRFDRELKDIFTIQDEITRNIVTEMAVTLAEGDNERLMQKKAHNVKAWIAYRRGVAQFRLFTKESNLKARKLAEKAIGLEPEYSEAYSLLGWTYAWPVRHGFSKSPKQDLQKAEVLVDKAKAFDPNNSDAQNLLGYIYVVRGQYERAIEEGQRAVELAPNNSDTYALLSLSLFFQGRSNEAIAAMTKAMRLAPFYPRWYLFMLGQFYFIAGQYEEAETAFKHRAGPDRHRTQAWLAVTYSSMGREDLARDHVKQALRINPAFCTEEWRKRFTPWKNREEVERILDIVHKAGIPEKPPQKDSN
jgi:adenylate cyclase